MASTKFTETGAGWTIEPEFYFTDDEREAIEDALLSLSANPYRQYEAHLYQLRELIASEIIPMRFIDYMNTLRFRDRNKEPVVLIKNVPYDRDVPLFDFDEPVESKYKLKKTFLAEGMLALFAELAGTPAIGYLNVNQGDVYQDIYPQRTMQDSQSQKALKEIFFHKDLANHFVRPDQVYMVGMRSAPANKVYTSFVRNIDIIDAFTSAEIEVLRSREFYTPFDDLTVVGGSLALGDADKHPVISEDTNIRYFENRTVGVTDRAKALVPKISETLHRFKQRLLIAPGDFVVTYNNHTIHAKEVVAIGDPEALRSRWILKTVNVDDLTPHRNALMPGTSHLVLG
ncbi:hypothetical protein [Rathayibacter toxicus]|uniref:hypothetical protein n=1 Tax=Rathayibacter toxicus TaxID=145458 RepID=UPI000CE8EAD0|nr:hypothetical protein [Rathayibacter toxicus]PPI55141.1 hypothetical protein C5D35_05290 [Rathayibacter toxicus]QOD09606.1 hypothetical protein BSG36_06385 [Rathayibacter toxicus]